jgi:hypothetical protein
MLDRIFFERDLMAVLVENIKEEIEMLHYG